MSLAVTNKNLQDKIDILEKHLKAEENKATRMDSLLERMFSHIHSVYSSSHSEPMDYNDLKPYVREFRNIQNGP